MFSALSRFGRAGAPAGRSLDAAVRALFPDVWYDPSDTATLFQDSAGTTPVTAVEQAVGLMLDKSEGLVLGAPLTISAWFNFTSIPYETFTTDGPTILSAVNSVTSGYAYTSELNMVPGRWYRVDVTIGLVSGAAPRISTGNNGGTNNTGSLLNIQLVNGANTVYFAYNGDGNDCLWIYNNTSASFSLSISVRELPGNHAFHTPGDTTTRPVLSRRINLLTKTEQFDDAAWTKTATGTASAPVVTTNVAIAPDGTLTADRVDFDRGAGNASSDRSTLVQFPTVSSTTYTGGFWIKAATAGDVGKTILFRNVAGYDYQSITLTADWVRIAKTETGSSSNFEIASRGGYTSSNQVSVILWGASLVPANLASLPYQRVNTATDYDSDASKFPSYLRCDGVNDSLQTNAIDFTATDKMFVSAGVRKLSDAAVGSAIHFSSSATVSAKSGVFGVYMPTTGGGTDPLWFTRGTATSSTQRTASAAPYSMVLSGIGDISGDISNLYVNGSRPADKTADQGTGNYGNYPLYIGRQVTVNPFDGWFFGAVIKGATLTAAQIALVERYLAGKTKTVVLA